LQIIEEAVTPLAGGGVGQISSAFYQMMKIEMRRALPKIELLGHHNRLVRLRARLDDPVGGAHADRKEARTDH
jgi:hypothetical protein